MSHMHHNPTTGMSMHGGHGNHGGMNGTMNHTMTHPNGHHTMSGHSAGHMVSFIPHDNLINTSQTQTEFGFFYSYIPSVI
jgi:hypothetical protein